MRIYMQLYVLLYGLVAHINICTNMCLHANFYVDRKKRFDFVTKSDLLILFSRRFKLF